MNTKTINIEEALNEIQNTEYMVGLRANAKYAADRANKKSKRIRNKNKSKKEKHLRIEKEYKDSLKRNK